MVVASRSDEHGTLQQKLHRFIRPTLRKTCQFRSSRGGAYRLSRHWQRRGGAAASMPIAVAAIRRILGEVGPRQAVRADAAPMSALTGVPRVQTLVGSFARCAGFVVVRQTFVLRGHDQRERHSTLRVGLALGALAAIASAILRTAVGNFPEFNRPREIASPSRHSTARCELSAIVYRQTPIHRQNVVGSSNGSRYPRSVRPTGCIGRDNRIGSQSLACLLTPAHRSRPVEENSPANCSQSLFLSVKHLCFAATTNESGIPRSGRASLPAPSPRSSARDTKRG